jgi:hypothetical protein
LSILEISQFTFIYTLIIIGATKLLDTYIFTTHTKEELIKLPTYQLIIKLIINLNIVILMFYIIIRIGKQIPSISYMINNKYKPYQTFDPYIYNIICVYIYLELISGLRVTLDILHDDWKDPKHGYF